MGFWLCRHGALTAEVALVVAARTIPGEVAQLVDGDGWPLVAVVLAPQRDVGAGWGRCTRKRRRDGRRNSQF